MYEIEAKQKTWTIFVSFFSMLFDRFCPDLLFERSLTGIKVIANGTVYVRPGKGLINRCTCLPFSRKTIMFNVLIQCSRTMKCTCTGVLKALNRGVLRPCLKEVKKIHSAINQVPLKRL